MISSELGNHVSRNCRRIGEWLVEMPNQFIDNCADIGGNEKLVMVGAKLLRRDAGEFKFVVAVFVETDRESLNGPIRVPGHQADNGARVDSTRQKSTKRHV